MPRQPSRPTAPPLVAWLTPLRSPRRPPLQRTEPLAPFLAGPEAFVLLAAQPPALSFLGRQRDGLSKDLFRARPVSAANVGEALQALFTSGCARLAWPQFRALYRPLFSVAAGFCSSTFFCSGAIS